MKARLFVTAAAAAIALIPSPALAWGKTGHRVVAAIADAQLSGLARAHIKEILGSAESLDEAANWPDEMRSAPTQFWQKTATPWHYVTLNGVLYDHAPSEGDALEALQRYTATLRDPNASLADKQLALRFIVHLVGDLHQPLHASTRVSKSQPNGDHGGNLVKLCSGCRDQLHGFWDGASGDDDTPAGIVSTAKTMHVATGAQTADLNPRHWADESLALAKSDVYHTPIGAGAGPFTVNSAYRQNAQKIAAARVTLAAARLAGILNAELK